MNNVNTFDNNAVRQIVETVRTVQGQAKAQNPSRGNVARSLKARITATIDDPGDPGTPLEFEFEAEQVSWDGLEWQAITNGKQWDDTKPLTVVSGGAVGDVLTADPVSNGANSTIWLALKSGGGGGAPTRLIVTADIIANNGVAFACTLADGGGAVTAIQTKFVTAKFYEDEIIYGNLDGANYLTDPYLNGIGGL